MRGMAEARRQHGLHLVAGVRGKCGETVSLERRGSERQSAALAGADGRGNPWRRSGAMANNAPDVRRRS